MEISKLITGLIIAVVAGGIISLVSGFAYDLMWNIGDYALVKINQCDTYQNGWIEQCENVKLQYNNGKTLIHFFSGIIPFIVILLFFSRLD